MERGKEGGEKREERRGEKVGGEERGERELRMGEVGWVEGGEMRR